MGALPGIGYEQTATARKILASVDGFQSIPGGGIIDGAQSRDPDNTGDGDILRAGLLMGKITSSGKWAPAVIGAVASAYDGGTTLTITPAQAAELVRRIGTSGTFKLTGPPTAGGTVRTLTVTYSAVNTSNGEITVTALNVNEVQSVALAGTVTAGGYSLRFNIGGVEYVTAEIAYDDDTAAIQTACNNAIDGEASPSNPTVTIGGTDATDFTITFGGNSVSGSEQNLVKVVETTTLSGCTGITVSVDTVGQNGAFVAGSLVQPTDGSEEIRSLIVTQWGVKVTDEDDDNIDVDYAAIITAGQLDASQIINYSSDSSIQAYIQSSLNKYGNFTFDDNYVG